MDANFQIPLVPKIFLPNESKAPSTPPPKQVLKTGKKVEKQNDGNKEKDSVNIVEDKPSKPKMCPNCSTTLLAYLKPIQEYINQVVNIAENVGQSITDAHVTPPTTPIQNEFIDECEEYKGKEVPESAPETKKESIEHINVISKEYEAQYQNVNYNIQNETSHSFMNYPVLNNDNRVDDSQYKYENVTPSDERHSDHNENFFSSDSKTNTASQCGTNYETHVPKNNEQDSPHSLSESKSLAQEESLPNIPSSKNEHIEHKEYKEHEKPPSIHSIDSVSSSNEEDSYDALNFSKIASFDENLTPQKYISEINSPYAYITVCYNNLTAANAIILANSLILKQNKLLLLNGRKVVIPIVILIGGHIHPILMEAINIVFDEIIYMPDDIRCNLLNDDALGIQMYKVHLWNVLTKYKSCLFIDSSALVVGKVTNLFTDCTELSAAVDWLFPDYFNCSIFLFCPSKVTYEDLIQLALSLQHSPNNHLSGEPLDEMTLLNVYFAPKWHRLSFIYNFIQNDAIYTQAPAFLKFGGNVKIVNFGHMGIGNMVLKNPSNQTNIQPWHISFDLLTSSVSDDVCLSVPINNYMMFYLLIFVKRLWPIIQKDCTEKMLGSHYAHKQCTIYELMRQLSKSDSGFETDDHLFNQQPLTMRKSLTNPEDLSKMMPASMKDMVKSQINDKIDDEDDDGIIMKNPQESGNSEPNDATYNKLKNDNENGNDVTYEEADDDKYESFQEQHEAKGRLAWETGRVDWMGAHQSDKILQRLQNIIDK